jgi:hypothetical protein
MRSAFTFFTYAHAHHLPPKYTRHIFPVTAAQWTVDADRYVTALFATYSCIIIVSLSWFKGRGAEMGP